MIGHAPLKRGEAFMIITALLTAASLQAEVATATCDLSWQQRGSRWSPSISCPEELEGATERFELNRIRIESFFQPQDREVTFINDGEGWDLEAITPLYRAPPSFPPNAVGRNVASHCYGTVQLRPNGRSESDNWICRTNEATGRNRYAQSFARAISQSIRKSYWLAPLHMDAPCLQLDYVFNVETPGQPASIAPDFPTSEIPKCAP